MLEKGVRSYSTLYNNGCQISKEKIINAIIANYHKRDCLIHSDAHTFNVLVEAKPSIEELETFGPYGTMVLCDWEMAMARVLLL